MSLYTKIIDLQKLEAAWNKVRNEYRDITAYLTLEWEKKSCPDEEIFEYEQFYHVDFLHQTTGGNSRLKNELLETGMGLLVRRKRENRYEWVIEI